MEKRQPGKLDIEEFQIARAGLKKTDLKTVALRINGHVFAFSSVDSFRNFAAVMLANADSFEQTAAEQLVQRPDGLRVIN